MPGESRELSPGGFYLIKQTLDQSNQQAANHVDQHCPEKVRHRLDLLSENMPTGWTIPVSQAEGNAVSLPGRLAALDERLNNAHKGREESTRIPSSPWGTSPGFLSVSLERAKVYAPMRAAYLSPGRTYLVKQALNQISQQAANKRGQRCPEEVQHRHLTSFRRTCPRAGQYPHPRRKATPFPCLAGLPPLTKG